MAIKAIKIGKKSSHGNYHSANQRFQIHGMFE